MLSQDHNALSNRCILYTYGMYIYAWDLKIFYYKKSPQKSFLAPKRKRKVIILLK